MPESDKTDYKESAEKAKASKDILKTIVEKIVKH